MKIFGIPLRIDPSFLFVVVVLAAGRLDEPALLVSWAVVVFVSVLLHELGHALAGRLFGLSPSIMLYGMGGLTYWDAGRALTPLRTIAVSLAGPLAGFALGAAVLGASVAAFGGLPGAEDGFAGQVVADLLWVNIGWGALNLLPILPLDGGNVMREVLNVATRGRGDIAARVVSLVLSGVAAFLALRFGMLWGGVLALFFAYQNGSDLYTAWRARSDPKTAYTMARMLARSGRPEEAVVWLRRAVAAGFRDPYTIAHDPDFASLRPLPEFQRLLDELA